MSDTWTWEEERAAFDQLSDEAGEWQGFPVPLGKTMPLVLYPGHPFHDIYTDPEVNEVLSEVGIKVPDSSDDRVINLWFDRKRNRQVFVVERDGGKPTALIRQLSPDRSMDRLDLWLTTLGASDAWDLDAEHKARDMLREMVTERQWRHYDLTGSFLETSERSGIMYMFRRLRPTIALSSRGMEGKEYLRCIGALCLHPIGYYDKSWAGCMVPTDDVVAHLTMMRADEAHYWGQANVHRPSDAEAGL